MTVIGFTNLANTEPVCSYYEVEATAYRSEREAGLASYYTTTSPAFWMSLTGEMVEDGRVIRPGEISDAFQGLAPNPLSVRTRAGKAVPSREIATNIGAPGRKASVDVGISDPKGYSALLRCAELAGEHDMVLALRRAKLESIRTVLRHAVELGLIRTRRGKAGTSSEVPRD